MNDLHRLLFFSCWIERGKKTFYWRWRPTTAGLSVSQRSSLQQRAFFPLLRATVHVREASHFVQYWPAIYRTRLFGASATDNHVTESSPAVCLFSLCHFVHTHTRRTKIIHCGFVKLLLQGSFKPEPLLLKDKIHMKTSFDIWIAALHITTLCVV